MSDSVDDIPVATNNDPNASRPFADQESKPEGSADGFDVVPQDKEDALESIQQGDAAGEIEITPSSVSSSQDAEPDATEAQDAAHGLPPSRQALDSDSGDSDKGLKRKLADRATSQGPENPVPLTSAESAKRPRDDTDKDDNPREQKRPSPPPEQQPATAETSTPKFVRHLWLFERLIAYGFLIREGLWPMLLLHLRLLLLKVRTSFQELAPARPKSCLFRHRHRLLPH
jgi:Ran-binding protein 3